jgi:hypothetical protein
MRYLDCRGATFATKVHRIKTLLARNFNAGGPYAE